jgi:hypothetical protein
MFSLPITSKTGTAQNASSSGNSYGTSSSPTIAQIINFHSGPRTLYWRFDLLHNDRTYKGDITPYVTKAVIQHDTSRAVKRSLDLDMVETVASQSVTISGGTITSAGIDYTNDFVQPICMIAVPNTSPQEWLHFPLITARFTRPGVTVPGYAVVRHASMPDLTSVVQENAATDNTNNGVGIPLTLPPGAYVIDVIGRLLWQATNNVPSNPATLDNLPGCALGTWLPPNAAGYSAPPAGVSNGASDWPTSSQIAAKIPAGGYQVTEGQSYLDLINHLLFTIGCYELMADQGGVFRIQQWPPNQDYRQQTSKDGYNLTISPYSQYSYDTTTDSIVAFGLTEDIMLDDVANVVEVIVEDATRTTYKATATNNDSHSPYSLANFGRRVVKTVRDSQVPDVDSNGINYAQQYAKQQLLMASWLTDRVTLPTAVNPLHAGGMDRDIVSLNIYQQYYAAGSSQNNPVITGAYIAAAGGDPGLIITQNFIQDGWTITANLANPGSGSNLTGNVGLTTVLEPRETKQGHVMSQTLHRITSTVSPASVTVS